MEKISVIIPMYNSETFIRQSVDSVSSQTYPFLEIIIIDDGSTDRSMEICKELKRKDSRICLLAQRHQGVSSARNQGIESATGKYIFFMDSDDMVHPYLLEKFVGIAEKYQTELTACAIKRWNDHCISKKVDKIFKEVGKSNWEISKDGKESEEWFHKKYFKDLTLIGGKMIRRDCIGTLRFDERLPNGEDTLFIYDLICKNIRIACLEQKWYFYRIHLQNTSQSSQIIGGKQYYEASRRIRDREFRKGQISYAIEWEKLLIFKMRQRFSVLKKEKKREECDRLKKNAVAERDHFLFRKLDISIKILYFCCFYFYLFYPVIKKIISALWWFSGQISKIRNFGSKRDKMIGVITFHCSDNYGAMLQAYGLKKYLFDRGVHVCIIRYEPFFMTGRHWWIPYIPGKKVNDCIRLCREKWKIHLQMGINYFWLRANMRHFREEYLIEKSQRILFFAPQLRKLPFRYYIVGSDQIWNPTITLGLRDVYFGAFPNRRKEKVIAYGASLGGKELPSKYDRKFSELIKYVDAVSLREEDAIPYVQKFYQGNVETVLDPVFLLERKHWLEIRKRPKQKDYILVYQTEYDHELVEYTKTLAKNTGLSVLELQAGTWRRSRDFLEDQTAGPAEFLGYIHQAAYVVSNSFHAIAFSIIFEKKFLAFLYGGRGIRIKNILRITGLENRLYEKGGNGQIDSSVDWKKVRWKIEEALERSEIFLEKNLDMQEI